MKTQYAHQFVGHSDVTYFVNECYSLRTHTQADIQARFEDMSKSMRDSYARQHFEIAKDYQQTLPKDTTHDTSFFCFGVKAFGESEQEFKQVLCIHHLVIASQLGLAKASFELAKIYQDEKYLVPSEDKQTQNTRGTNKTIAKSYALTAERQANNQDEPDGKTLLDLAIWHEASSFSIGKNRDAERCEKAAANFGLVRKEENCLIQ